MLSRVNIWTHLGNSRFYLNKTSRPFFGGSWDNFIPNNLERRPGQRKVFMMIDICLRAESQIFPLVLCSCQAFLYWLWVVLTVGVPERLALCSAHRRSAKASWSSSVNSMWKSPFPDPAELVEENSALLLKLESGVFLPTTGVVSWMSSSRLVGARSLAGDGSE